MANTKRRAATNLRLLAYPVSSKDSNMERAHAYIVVHIRDIPSGAQAALAEHFREEPLDVLTLIQRGGPYTIQSSNYRRTQDIMDNPFSIREIDPAKPGLWIESSITGLMRSIPPTFVVVDIEYVHSYRVVVV